MTLPKRFTKPHHPSVCLSARSFFERTCQDAVFKRPGESLINRKSLENPFASTFRISLAGFVLVLASLLCLFVPPAVVFVPLVVAASIWAVFHRPVRMLGVVLAIMPIHFLPIMIGQFYGVPHMTVISACTKEAPLILLALILWRRNGFKPLTPDWLLLACFMLAVVRTALGGEVGGLLLDFEFLIAYFLGRVTIVTAIQERLWAKGAVWIAAVLSVIGMAELLILGDGPRKVLYALVTAEGILPASFGASMFEGLRAASTMVGPPSFGALCMICLIIWWVYLRQPLPAAIIAAGLVCALTRSAWIGTAAALSVLAFRLDQKKRFIGYAAVALVAFIAAIPFLGLADYIFHTRKGTDESEQVHRESELRGINYVITHPLGSGAGTVGPVALANDKNAVVTENTYLAFAAQYGIPASLCFAGFLFTALRLAWQKQSRLAHVAVGILIAFGLMMTVFLVHDDFRLACWVWFPVGLYLRTYSVVHAYD